MYLVTGIPKHTISTVEVGIKYASSQVPLIHLPSRHLILLSYHVGNMDDLKMSSLTSHSKKDASLLVECDHSFAPRVGLGGYQSRRTSHSGSVCLFTNTDISFFQDFMCLVLQRDRCSREMCRWAIPFLLS